jgi:hypothetical protein
MERDFVAGVLEDMEEVLAGAAAFRIQLHEVLALPLHGR